mmetsp:Transcript_13868/g.20448  ORF Transcript_13868/g.20448 Transcript_13868/m.20448 type:complete len:282 (+) Transcript_13868:181-1026(+)
MDDCALWHHYDSMMTSCLQAQIPLFRGNQEWAALFAFLKKASVQGFDGVIDTFAVNDKANVDLGGTLGKHLNLYSNLVHYLEDIGHHLRGAIQVADDGHNGATVLDLYLRKLLQVFHQCIKAGLLLLLLQGQRHRHLTGGDHVHRLLVLLEQPKDFGKKSVRAQHPRGHHIDQGDTVFDGNGGGQLVARTLFLDQRPRMLWVVRVLHTHWDAGPHGWQHAHWMKHLGSKVCQLCSLLVGHLWHWHCGLNHAWVSGQDPVHVLPNLHFIDPQSCSDAGRGEV